MSTWISISKLYVCRLLRSQFRNFRAETFPSQNQQPLYCITPVNHAINPTKKVIDASHLMYFLDIIISIM